MARPDLKEKLAARAETARVPVTFCGEPCYLVRRPYAQFQRAGAVAAAAGAFDTQLWTLALIALSLVDETGDPVFDLDSAADLAALGAAAPGDIVPLAVAVPRLYGLTGEATDPKDSPTTPSGANSSASPAPSDASPVS